MKKVKPEPKKNKHIVLKRKNRKPAYIPYEFARNSPEPCFVNPTSIHMVDHNRLIQEEEKTINILVGKFEHLNVHAQRLLSDLCWVVFYKTVSTQIDRVSRTSPWFGRHFYKVRFCGYHGPKVLPVFLITKEDDSDRHVILGISADACKKCGGIDCLFKLTTKSKITRCAKCRGLPGVRTGL